MDELSQEDQNWLLVHLPADGNIVDAARLFTEAQVLSSYEHLAAVFGVTVDDLAPYKVIIERARRIAEHEYFTKLKERVAADDRDAIRIYAELLKLIEMDRSAPPTEEDKMTDEKMRALFRKG